MMSWEDQGRQYHMWFGHGTASDRVQKEGSDPSVTGQSTDERVLALAYGAVAALPASLRRQAEAQYQRGTLTHLKGAMTAWIKGTRLDQATFAGRFFGRAANDPVVRNLHEAALDAATATSHADIRDASGKLADAIKAVGVDQWPRFVADASERARDPATQAAIEKSRQPPDPARDAIRPVYPVETAIGVVAAGVAGGVGAAARAVGGAILRQVLPESRPSPTGTAGGPKPEGNSAPSAANRAGFEKYTDGLRGSMDRPPTADPKLSGIMDEMYRPNAKVGSGSTAAAVRSERATGQPVGGRWHTQKAEEGVNRLQRWLQANPMASSSDRAAAENVLRDLKNALAGQ